jgi:titin
MSATVSWVAPVNPGSSPINGYRVDVGPAGIPGAIEQSITVGPETRGIVVTQLNNGTLYQFDVYALNTGGESAPGSASATPAATVPGPPTQVFGTRGDRQVTLTWKPPLDNGGSTITDYRIVAYGVGAPTPATYYVPTLGDPTFSRATINGLTNGMTYTFDVSAGNLTGPGGAVAYGNPGTSNPVTPATVPGVPTGVSANGRHQSAIVSWTPPADNGGDPISGYRITVSPFIYGSPFTTGGSDTSYNVSGLTNGTTYSFTVTAFNTVGSGAASAAVTAIPHTTVPDAPAPAAAGRGNQQVAVSWTVPLYDGGLAIDGYRVEVYTGATLVRTVPTPPALITPNTATSTTVTGLNNGTAYTFKVYAHNGLGFSAAATAGPVTPATVPDMPIWRDPVPPVSPDVSGVTLGDGQATLRWNPYPNTCTPLTPPPTPCHPTGGDPVSGYDVVTMSGGLPVPGLTVTTFTSGSDSPSAVVAGLINGTEYTFRVRAKNGAGEGPYVTSAAVRPGPRVTLTTSADTLTTSGPSYGPVLMGSSSKPMVITVTNWGSADLMIDGPVIGSTPGGVNFTAIFDNCSGNILAAKTSCRVELTFTPQARGAITGTFWVSSNSIDPSPILSLSGSGVGPALSYSPTSIAFGNQNVGTQSDPVRTVRITNTGDRDLHITSISIDGFGAPNFMVDQVYDLCTAATVIPGGFCTVGIRFAPIRAGYSDATLRVEHDAFADPPRVTLSGTGVAGPPGAPNDVIATYNAASPSATITWGPPASDGGSPIQYYRLTCMSTWPTDPACTTPRTTSGPVTSYSWTGLMAGETYTFSVSAVNALGTGPATVSNPVP